MQGTLVCRLAAARSAIPAPSSGQRTGAGSQASLTVSGGTVNNVGTIEVLALGEGPLAANSPAASGSVDATNLVNTGTLKAAATGTISFFEQGGIEFQR